MTLVSFEFSLCRSSLIFLVLVSLSAMFGQFFSLVHDFLFDVDNRRVLFKLSFEFVDAVTALFRTPLSLENRIVRLNRNFSSFDTLSLNHVWQIESLVF